jgi:hypothetical protein
MEENNCNEDKAFKIFVIVSNTKSGVKFIGIILWVDVGEVLNVKDW